MNTNEIKELIAERCDTLNSKRAEIEKLAEEIYKEGFENIFFAGSGGSITSLMAFAYFFKKYSRIPAFVEEAAELNVANYKQLNEKSLVVIMAKTGTMVETVELSQYCKEHNIKTIGFVIFDNTPVANNVTYKVIIDEPDTPARYITMYQLLFRLMYLNGDFDDYEDFIGQLNNVYDVLAETIDHFNAKAKNFAEKYHDEKFMLYLYSGSLKGEVLKYSADVGEELFRIKSQLMHTAEFFHGCLEIVDDDLCSILFMNEDESRAMDERCLRFMEKYGSKKLTVFDSKELRLDSIKQKYRPLFTPMVVYQIMCGLISPYMKEVTGLSVKTRRYYGVVEY